MVVLDDSNLLFAQSYSNFQQLAAITKASLKTPLNRMKPQEKMPPRFNVKGMSVAVRVLGHEIRHVTYMTTGKDLADLRYSCPDILRKLGQAAKDKKIPFAKLTIPSFDFPRRNLNEFDFNGNCIVQRWDTFRVPKVPEVTDDELLSCSCTCDLERSEFEWKDYRINESELQRIASLFTVSACPTKGNITDENNEWKVFMKFNKYNVWRRKLNNSGKYEYKIHGIFEDVCANSFYQTQDEDTATKHNHGLSSDKIDNGYRCLWDSYALAINVLKKDPLSSCEIVQWTTKCPYPMKSREYLFLRSAKIYDEDKVAVVLSRSTEHPDYPETDDFVRCGSYESKMAIKPLNEFDQNGMEFILIYSDDPQAMIPSYLLDMITSSGISEMMSKMHKAAKQMKTDDHSHL